MESFPQINNLRAIKFDHNILSANKKTGSGFQILVEKAPNENFVGVHQEYVKLRSNTEERVVEDESEASKPCVKKIKILRHLCERDKLKKVSLNKS